MPASPKVRAFARPCQQAGSWMGYVTLIYSLENQIFIIKPSLSSHHKPQTRMFSTMNGLLTCSKSLLGKISALGWSTIIVQELSRRARTLIHLGRAMCNISEMLLAQPILVINLGNCCLKYYLGTVVGNIIGRLRSVSFHPYGTRYHLWSHDSGSFLGFVRPLS